jgi:hypothetical protein
VYLNVTEGKNINKCHFKFMTFKSRYMNLNYSFILNQSLVNIGYTFPRGHRKYLKFMMPAFSQKDNMKIFPI